MRWRVGTAECELSPRREPIGPAGRRWREGVHMVAESPVGDRAPSPRRQELLELAYRHVLDTGLTDMSLRPLATAIGSSPRVLLFLFGSKDNLIRCLLAKARE